MIYRMMRKILIVLLLVSNTPLFSQNVLDIDGIGCPLEGSAKRKNDQALNRLKNRFVMPLQTDFDTGVIKI